MSLADLLHNAAQTITAAAHGDGGGVSHGYSSGSGVSSGYTNAAYDYGGGGDYGDYGGGYGGGGGGGYGGGGGGGGSSDEDAKKDLQSTIKNLGDIYGRKKDQLEKDTKAKLDNVKQKQAANDALLTRQQTAIRKQNTWQPQQQKEQSTLMALRNKMGNSAYGSGIVDLMEGMARVDDMADVELINTYRNNMDASFDDWYQAAAELVGDYNSDIQEAKSSMADLLNQYQAALNNVSPGAAEIHNIEKAYTADDVEAGWGDKQITLPKVDLSESKDFKALTGKNMENPTSVNALTKGYYRPDQAQTKLGGNKGTYNTAANANRGFSDNLKAYRRV